MNQLLAKLVLTRAGCKVTIAENGVRALEKLKEDKFDIILMDIQMPEMDGYQTTTIIRSDLETPLSEIPIMAMTAHALAQEKDKCMYAGMNDYISKPFEADELFSKIVALVKKDREVPILENE
jgi:CheY-like chemotaxis protein